MNFPSTVSPHQQKFISRQHDHTFDVTNFGAILFAKSKRPRIGALKERMGCESIGAKEQGSEFAAMT